MLSDQSGVTRSSLTTFQLITLTLTQATYVKCEYIAEIVETNNDVELSVLDRVALKSVELRQDYNALNALSRLVVNCGLGRLYICRGRHKQTINTY